MSHEDTKFNFVSQATNYKWYDIGLKDQSTHLIRHGLSRMRVLILKKKQKNNTCTIIYGVPSQMATQPYASQHRAKIAECSPTASQSI